MNREERREKRQRDTKKAVISFIVFLMVIALLVAGVVFAVTTFLLKDKEEPVQQAQNGEIEQQVDTEQAEVETSDTAVEDPLVQQARDYVAGMSLEDKIAQMFIITPDELTGVPGATAAGDATKEAYNSSPVGGIIYMSDNLKDAEQTTTMLTKMQEISMERTGLPIFLSVDEEGGSVTRIAGKSGFDASDVGDMSAVGATGDAQNAYNAGSVIGSYLKELGFNMDFAPVADVLTNSENTVIGDRAFGSDSQLVADMVTSELKGLSDQGIYGVVKHFPGHGNTSEDSHDGAAVSEKVIEELRAVEFVPFQRAIDSGVSFIMVGHISLPNVTGDNTPASLSGQVMTDILRTEMGYQGVVITDAMNMKAITENYTADQAAVMAVSAGADIILMPQDYETAYQGLLDAVNNGTITEERINESLVRIVRAKLAMNQ